MLNRFFSFFSHDLGIDLGTANTLVYVKGKGIVIREPSVVVRHKTSKKILSMGNEAKKMIGKTPINLAVVRPLRDGVISDLDVTEQMLSYYIQKIHETPGLFPKMARPRTVIGIPSGVTEVERRAVWEAALRAGSRQAYLIEEPMAAAIGSGIDITQPVGALIVDIGGGTTEIAVISLGGIVVSRSLRIAGDELDEAIINYIRLRHGLLLGEKTAEEIKMQIGSAYQKTEDRKQKTEDSSSVQSVIRSPSSERVMVVRGRDLESGLPRSLRLTENEIREALAPIVTQIIEAVVDTLEETPPELMGDILEKGIILTGGGALLSGLDRLIMEHTRMPVVIADDPLTTVVRGAAKVLEDDRLLEQVRVRGGLK
ncbi:rod shape-determining protein [Candidatus Microgenomates bacterium]|nr:rod shape-determining protein [Candidatus Microgenomates bacterium]